MRIEVLFEVAIRIGFRNGKEPVIKAHFGVRGVSSADPVNGALNLAAGGSAAGLAVQVSRAAQFYHIAVRVFNGFIALDDVGILEPNFAPWPQTEIFWGRDFHEIVPF